MKFLTALCVFEYALLSLVARAQNSASTTPASTCRSDQYRCSNGNCIPRSWLCDGILDCSDSGDEENCASCKSYAFNCGNGRCVQEYLKCNGQDDCGNSRDETQSLCVTTTSTSTSQATSTRIPTTTAITTTEIPTTTALCSNGYFDCGNAQCKPASWLCDGDNDCGNNADEQNCSSCVGTNSFYCGNGLCIRTDLRCNGINNCGNSQDEVDCRSSTEFRTTAFLPTTESPEQRANRICKRVYPDADPLISRDETCEVMCRGRRVTNGSPDNFIKKVQKRNGLTCGNDKECMGGKCRRSIDVQRCKQEMANGVKNIDDVSECRIRCRNGKENKMVDMQDGNACSTEAGSGACKNGRCIVQQNKPTPRGA